MKLSSPPVGVWSPGVSTKTICAPARFLMPVIRLRVVWGRGETIASFWPTRRFRSVDLPVFGRPINETNPARVIVAGPARPVPSVGGLRRGATPLRSACPGSFQRGPRGRCHRWGAGGGEGRPLGAPPPRRPGGFTPGVSGHRGRENPRGPPPGAPPPRAPRARLAPAAPRGPRHAVDDSRPRPPSGTVGRVPVVAGPRAVGVVRADDRGDDPVADNVPPDEEDELDARDTPQNDVHPCQTRAAEARE